ncbi:hypothetical protein LZ906_017870 (plasmid) [Paraclostridium ghonii]|uniref:hypothetical protein n=1 Tax=Paraclostridium ghonii TaxID=29358 RepID=UPI00202CAD46|nr:hypothetical protein [Paeniclostridium ghonii]MCM0167414.1 hypothetical protein [Paeniclostridium ghonii]
MLKKDEPKSKSKKEYEEALEVAKKMVELKKKIPNTINVMVDVMKKINDNPEQGKTLLKQLAVSTEIYSNEEIEMKSLEYLIKKEQTTADLFLESIK